MLARSSGANHRAICRIRPSGGGPLRKKSGPCPVGLDRTVAYNGDRLAFMLEWIGEVCICIGPLASIEEEPEVPDIIGGASTHHEVPQILVVPIGRLENEATVRQAVRIPRTVRIRDSQRVVELRDLDRIDRRVEWDYRLPILLGLVEVPFHNGRSICRHLRAHDGGHVEVFLKV